MYSNQEQVSLHGGCVPGGELEQTTFPEKLVCRIDYFLLSDHLVDFQQTLQALLKAKKHGEKTLSHICRYGHSHSC